MQPDWDELYQDGIKPWDKGTAAPPLLDWMNRNPQKLSGKIMVPGCGLGHDVRAIADVCPVAEVLGIDISGTALQEAAAFAKSGAERYEELDLFDLPGVHHQSFDWIWEHTCFCAIDPERRDDYVEAVHRALKPDGELLGIFYLDPYDEDHQPGGGPPHGTSVAELESRFVGSGRFEITEKYVPEVSYRGRAGLELMLRLKPSAL
ncbi:MAG: methyltransferase domain-containing protein [Verrucomicrobiales bacterium]|nr:methyltransferase domain-containing protein [Verrucomicrobiales bacterium]